jgi:cardiolipin synthase
MFWTIPTIMTWTRIVAIPLIVGVFYLPRTWPQANLIATVMFVVFAATDWLDGYLARKLNQTSSFGAFLDPVADKFLVCASLLVLVHLKRADVFVGLIIIGREIAISALREWMAQIGASRSVAVHMIGKLKTVGQMVAIPFLLFDGSAVRRDGYAHLGHLADLDRGRADRVVDGVLPAGALTRRRSAVRARHHPPQT